MRRLEDARDTPACRALGRSWWRRWGRTVRPAEFDTRPVNGQTR